MKILSSLTTIILLVFVTSSAVAKSTYLTRARTTYPIITGTKLDDSGDCMLCHVDISASSARNAYGTAYGNASHSFTAIESADSDGDGFTNLVEIQNLAFPGFSSDMPPNGSVKVTILPVGAVTGGAQWRVAPSGTYQASGATVSKLLAGAQTVQFKAISGWTTPADIKLTITAGQTATPTGTYEVALVTVPNLANQTQAAATTTLTTAGLAAGNVSYAFSSTAAAGTVVDQSPVAGSQVAPGSSVALVLAQILKVSVPDGGEAWIPGSSHTLAWNAVPSITAVKVKLLKGGVLYRWLSESAPNTGSFTWMLPVDLPLASDYQVKLNSAADLSIKDTSNGNFSAVASALQLSSPNGGEQWMSGSIHNITWNPAAQAGASVKLKLYKGGLFNQWISGPTPNTGTYAWTLPMDLPVAANYRVEVYSASDLTLVDFSNADFAVVASPIQIVSPNGGETWVRGTTHNIVWSPGNNVATQIKLKLFKGGVFNRWISGPTANSGSFSWTIPADVPAGTDYRVQIYSASDFAITDFGNDDFCLRP